VNSTIIEHMPASATLEGGPASAGKRGMHSAHGAYWNSEEDGMWTFKYDGADVKGLDVVVGIIWISV
jgi:Tctex-1 family